MSANPKKPAADWERIELDYRAGLLSVREIAAAHGISHTAINKRAKAEKWDRDLQAKIRAKAEALVSKAVVSAEVSKERAETEKATIDANAQAMAEVRLRHRTDIAGLLAEVRELAAELRMTREQQGALASAAEALADGSDPAALRKALDRAVSLPARAGMAKTLAETLAKLVPLEREAWGLDDEGKGASDFERLLTEIHDATAHP